jgi:hypothetical protein
MAQPVAASAYKQVSAKGTTLVSDIPVNLQKVIIGGTFVGSVEWYDSATTAGTAATNLIFNVGIPATNQYRSIDLGLHTKNGLVEVSTGTPVITYTLD